VELAHADEDRQPARLDVGPPRDDVRVSRLEVDAVVGRHLSHDLLGGHSSAYEDLIPRVIGEVGGEHAPTIGEQTTIAPLIECVPGRLLEEEVHANLQRVDLSASMEDELFDLTNPHARLRRRVGRVEHERGQLLRRSPELLVPACKEPYLELTGWTRYRANRMPKREPVPDLVGYEGFLELPDLERLRVCVRPEEVLRVAEEHVHRLVVDGHRCAVPEEARAGVSQFDDIFRVPEDRDRASGEPQPELPGDVGTLTRIVRLHGPEPVIGELVDHAVARVRAS
jgi:hypothetical protein